MPYYKDKNNNIHFLDNEKFEQLLPSGCLKITDIEANAIQNPPLTLDQAKANKLTDLANYRYEKECGGTTVSGMEIKTDRESQAKISGAVALAIQIPTMTFNWKSKKGFVALDKTQITAIGQAVGVFVQACYTNEMAHAKAIEALTTVAAIEAYDITTGWPG
ncbi:DUF4376 domain-containing protein [Syntrophus aciditrophicus]|nr:DUF4376 domain-containing protein [Syntrophus aciditrophicus]